ncbi:MAG TPA: hypothetical protein PK286_10420 [Devosia sp.]|nr:hypothetical protein [Devosia sp.]
MKTSIYIVIFSREAWWIDLDGDADGPFGTLDAAIRNAVDKATATSDAGGRSEVRVIGPGHENAMVYQSADKSLLARIVAMAH